MPVSHSRSLLDAGTITQPAEQARGTHRGSWTVAVLQACVVCLFVESQMCHTIIGIGPAPEWEDIHLFVKDTTTA